MAIFNIWKNNTPRSKEAFTHRLFSHLSPDYFPVNVIGTELYDIFEMYGVQLASGSAEIYQVLRDLAISSVRTTAISTSNLSKMYENFGVLYEVSRLFEQNFDAYSYTYTLQPYRQNLKFIADAAVQGTTIEAINQVGRGYTGMAPVIVQPLIDKPGWRLTTHTGSVVAKGNNFFLLDKDIPKIGRVIPTDRIDEITVGQDIVLSWSKLGINTKLGSAYDYYSGLRIYVFSTGSIQTDSFKASIENAFDNVKKADLHMSVLYRDKFVFWKPTTNPIPDEFSLQTGDFLINSKNISPTGAVIYSPVLTLPSDYKDYNWFYDWATLLRNEANVLTRVRQYPISTIPESVYFNDITPEYVDLLPVSDPTGSVHWVFDTQTSAEDISGNQFRLPRINAVGTGSIPIRGRDLRRVGVRASGSALAFEAPVSNFIDLSAGTFGCEMWLYGADTGSVPSGGAFTIKRDSAGPRGHTLNGTGFRLTLDVAAKQLQFEMAFGTNAVVTGSVASILSEQPSRYHYFAAGIDQGRIFLYADDKILNVSYSTIALPDLSNAFTGIYTTNTTIGIDELLVSKDALIPSTAKARFLATRSRLYFPERRKDNVERYHQSEIVVRASGSNEAEIHAFSIRGLEDFSFSAIPVFPTGSLPHVPV